MMRLAVGTATALALLAVLAGQAFARPAPDPLVQPAMPLELSGPHVNGPGFATWATEAEANVPLPTAHLVLRYGDPATYFDNYGDPFPVRTAEVDLPRVGRQGWTAEAVHGDFVHEVGHVFDHYYMTPALRRTFMWDAGAPTTCTRWWGDCKTVRWIVNDHSYITLPPAEMFAEEYAACALGLTQRQYQDAGYNSYGWVPARGVLDSTLCGVIRSAA